MRLNHIDLQVPDVQETADFLEHWFAFERVGNRQSPAIAILRRAGNFTLVLQRRAEGESYPEGFHIGFLLDDVDEVLTFQARARAAGLRISDVQQTGRGTLTYLRAPGVLIEVSSRARAG